MDRSNTGFGTNNGADWHYFVATHLSVAPDARYKLPVGSPESRPWRYLFEHAENTQKMDREIKLASMFVKLLSRRYEKTKLRWGLRPHTPLWWGAAPPTPPLMVGAGAPTPPYSRPVGLPIGHLMA